MALALTLFLCVVGVGLALLFVTVMFVVCGLWLAGALAEIGTKVRGEN
jgi:hypothetical protein